MQKIEKDDIIIRKGIIHILDSHNGYLGLSNDLLDMGPDLMEFVRGHIFKILDSDDQRNASLMVAFLRSRHCWKICRKRKTIVS